MQRARVRADHLWRVAVQGLEAADFVVEAATEKEQLKQSIFQTLDQVGKTMLAPQCSMRPCLSFRPTCEGGPALHLTYLAPPPPLLRWPRHTASLPQTQAPSR